jgi:hypothetical protein
VRTNTRRRATGKLISCLSARPRRLGCRGRWLRCGEPNRSTSDVEIPRPFPVSPLFTHLPGRRACSPKFALRVFPEIRRLRNLGLLQYAPSRRGQTTTREEGYHGLQTRVGPDPCLGRGPGEGLLRREGWVQRGPRRQRRHRPKGARRKARRSADGRHETAFSYREATWSAVYFGVDPDPANNERIISWTKEYWEAVHPHSGGGAYVNFMMDEGQERVKATYRDNYERLVAIKNKYDPTNLFRVNQNIRPTATV